MPLRNGGLQHIGRNQDEARVWVFFASPQIFLLLLGSRQEDHGVRNFFFFLSLYALRKVEEKGKKELRSKGRNRGRELGL